MKTNQRKFDLLKEQKTKKQVLKIAKQDYKMMCMCWL